MDIIFEIESFEQFEIVSKEIINNLFILNNVTKSPIESSFIKAAKDDLKNIISSSNYDINKISETLLSKRWDQEKMKYFLELLNDNKSQLLHASLDHYNSSYGEILTEFDWLVKLVLGTSELKTLQYPLLQLLLTTIDNNGACKKNMLDINKDVLLKIIHTLEKLDEL